MEKTIHHGQMKHGIDIKILKDTPPLMVPGGAAFLMKKMKHFN